MEVLDIFVIENSTNFFEWEISWVTSSLLSQEHNAKHKATATFIEREAQTKPGM